MPAVLKHGILHVRADPAEDRSRLAACSYEGGCFIEGFVRVLLQREAGVEQAAYLADLSVGKVSNDLTDEFYDLYSSSCVLPPSSLSHIQLRWFCWQHSKKHAGGIYYAHLQVVQVSQIEG